MTSWEGLPPVPVRVLVKGASNTVHVAPPGGPRTHQVYARWLEPLLAAKGLPAIVRNGGAEGQKVSRALCDWNDDVERWSPDVVVLSYGMYEAMPGMLPRWLERHAVGWHHHPGPVRERYRQRFLMPLWRRLARLQRRIDPRLARPGPFRHSPTALVAELARYVAQARTVGSPLVLITDTYEVESPWIYWFPGMNARLALNGQAIREWIAKLGDPEVRIFAISEIIDRHDRPEALPDGVHFSAEVHREIAEELATEILAWSRSQPHLQHSSAADRSADRISRA